MKIEWNKDTESQKQNETWNEKFIKFSKLRETPHQ